MSINFYIVYHCFPAKMRSCTIAMDPGWPEKPKIFTTWSFISITLLTHEMEKIYLNKSRKAFIKIHLSHDLIDS